MQAQRNAEIAQVIDWTGWIFVIGLIGLVVLLLVAMGGLLWRTGPRALEALIEFVQEWREQRRRMFAVALLESEHRASIHESYDGLLVWDADGRRDFYPRQAQLNPPRTTKKPQSYPVPNELGRYNPLTDADLRAKHGVLAFLEKCMQVRDPRSIRIASAPQMDSSFGIKSREWKRHKGRLAAAGALSHTDNKGTWIDPGIGDLWQLYQAVLTGQLQITQTTADTPSEPPRPLSEMLVQGELAEQYAGDLPDLPPYDPPSPLEGVFSVTEAQP